MGRSTSGGAATRTTSKPSGTVSVGRPGCCAEGQPASAPTPRETPASAQAVRRTGLVMHASRGCGTEHHQRRFAQGCPLDTHSPLLRQSLHPMMRFLAKWMARGLIVLLALAVLALGVIYTG